MPRAIYVPVFDSFFEGSIMMENLTTRFVMLALIRLAWRSGAAGEVDVDPRIFAQSINLPLEDVEKAITRLMEPDPASANPDEDGRRIVPINPDRPHRGWRLVNWPKYRIMVNRINDAARQREAYHSKKYTSKTSESLQNSPEISESLQIPPCVSEIPENPVTIRDETRRNETKKESGRFAPPSLDDVKKFITEKGYHFSPEAFIAYYEEREWKRNDGKKLRDWHLACVTWESREEKVSSGRRSVEHALGPTNSLGIRPSKDGISMCYKGDWYYFKEDGKRWLTDESFRPDGSNTQNDARDPVLNEKVYAAMNELAAQASK